MSGRDIVITGVGLISPLGQGVEGAWANLKGLKTGITSHLRDNLPAFLGHFGEVAHVELACEIPHRLSSQMKFLNRGSLLGFAAACEAVSHSGIDLTTVPRDQRGLYIASGDLTKIGYDFMYPATRDGADQKWQEMDYEKLNLSALYNVNPFFLLESIANNAFSFISAYFEFMGPSTTLASLSSCGGNALELAWRGIKYHQAEVALAIGCGSWITEIPVYEMENLGLISQCRSGAQSFRPFDRKRDGFIPAEGGAAIFLETAERALQRGAGIIGTIRGFGNSMGFSPHGGFGVPEMISRQSMTSALTEAGCDLDEIAFISAHGNGSQKGDRSELRSIAEVFHERRTSVPICGLKPYTGHMGAASDIAEVIFGVKALKDRMIPATLNYDSTEKEFSELEIPKLHQPCTKGAFLSVSNGIGGQSSSVVVESIPL